MAVFWNALKLYGKFRLIEKDCWEVF